MAEATEVLQSMVDAFRTAHDEYMKAAREMQDAYGKGQRPGRQAREQEQLRRRAEMEASKKTATAFSNLSNTLTTAEAEFKTMGSMFNETAEQLNTSVKQINQMIDQGLNVDQRTADLARKLQRQGRLTSTELGELRSKANELTEQYAKKIDTIDRDIGVAKRFRFWLDHVTDKMRETADAYVNLKTGLATTGVGIYRYFEEVQQAAQLQMGTLSMLGGSIEEAAFHLGMMPRELQEFYGQNRQIINAMADDQQTAAGAIGSTTRFLKGLQSEVYQLTGDMAEANKLIMSGANMFVNAGIDISKGGLRQMLEDGGPFHEGLRRLTEMTGQSSAEMTELMNQHVQSQGVQENLIKMSERQRRAYMQQTLAVTENMVAQGKTAEAALRAQEAMAGLAGMDPRERLREGARLSAVMGAMGVEGGGRMMRLMQQGPAQWQEGDRGFFTERADELMRRRQEALGGGGSQMYTAAALFGRLGGETMNVLQEQQTEMNVGRKLDQDRNAVLKDIQKRDKQHLTWAEDTATTLKSLHDEFMAFVRDPALNIFGGLGLTLGAIGKHMVTMLGIMKGAEILGGGAALKTVGQRLGTAAAGPLAASIGTYLGAYGLGSKAYQDWMTINQKQMTQDAVGPMVDALGTVIQWDTMQGAIYDLLGQEQKAQEQYREQNEKLDRLDSWLERLHNFFTGNWWESEEETKEATKETSKKVGQQTEQQKQQHEEQMEQIKRTRGATLMWAPNKNTSR